MSLTARSSGVSTVGDLSIGTTVGFEGVAVGFEGVGLEGVGRKDEVVVCMVYKDPLVTFEGAHS